MCGRFTLTNPSDEIAGYFDVLVDRQLAPRYNIAPTQPVSCVRAGDQGGRELSDLRWGLIPRWAKDPAIGSRMINARAETVAEKPAYKEAFRKRRCLVVADGFFEWKRVGATKQPYLIYMTDRRPFAFAGLWEAWRPREGQLEKISGPGRPEIPITADGRVESCSFLTTGPNELMREIHDRMPVILSPDKWENWLDPQITDSAALTEMLSPYPAALMQAHPVSTRVNKPANDDAECVEPLKTVKIKRPGAGSAAPENPGQARLFD